MIYDFEFRDNQYIVTEYSVYYRRIPSDDESVTYYGSYADVEAETNALFQSPYLNRTGDWYRCENFHFDSFEEKINKDFDSYRDRLTKIIYTFEVKDGVLTLVDYVSSK